MRRSVLFIAAVLVCVSAYVLLDDSDYASAEDPYSGSCGADAKYSFDTSTGVLTISGSGSMKDYSSKTQPPWASYRGSITSVVFTGSVTYIGYYAFSDLTALTSVDLGPVTSIGQHAFKSCTSLSTVDLGSVTSLGPYAFISCTRLSSVTIPNSVTSIGNSAFSSCKSLTSVTIPNSITSLESNVFSNCTGLTTVVIPDTVTSMGDCAFSGCTELTELTIPISLNAAGSSSYSAFRYCVNIEKVTFTKGTGTGFDYGTGSTSSNYYGNTPWYLSRAALKEVVLQEGITSIGSYAFFNCPAQITADFSSVKTFGAYSFNGCTGLTALTIPDSATIGDSAFIGCTGLKDLTIPISLNAVGSGTNPIFKDSTSLEKVTFTKGTGTGYDYGTDSSSPDYYENMPWYLSRSALKEVVFSDGITSIGDYTLCYCSALTSVTVPDTVTSVGEFAFRSCSSLPSVDLGSVTSVGHCAFRECSGLTSVDLGSVTSIGSGAFRECTGLTSLIISESVTSLGGSAFSGCTGLNELTIPISINAVNSGSDPVFNGCTNIEKVTFTKGTGEGFDYELSSTSLSYYGNTPWYLSKSVLKEIVIPDGVTSFGAYSFCDCTVLTSVDFSSVTSVGDSAFSRTGLTSADLSSVTTIGPSAFSDCTLLKELTIPISVNAVGSGSYPVFKNCTNLEKVTFTAGSGEGYDYGNDSTSSDYYGYTPWYLSRSVLKEVVLPDGIRSVGDYALYGCSGLSSVTIPDTVTSVGDNAFRSCTSITSLTLPSTVTEIGDNAFRSCSSLTVLDLGSVMTVGDGAFRSCTALTELTVPVSLNAVGSNNSPIFSECTGLERITISKGTGTGYCYGSSSSATASDYYGYTPWHICKDSLKEIVLSKGITSIGDYMFCSFSESGPVSSSGHDVIGSPITSITVPDTVTSIGDHAFFGCSGLTSLTVPDSVMSVGDSAFCGCTSIVSVDLGSVTFIGDSAFRNCSSLTKVKLGPVESLGDSVFEGCTSLGDIEVSAESTVYCTEDGVLFTRDKTELIRYPAGKAVTSYKVPDGVKSIAGYAFDGCTSLAVIDLNSVEALGGDVFSGSTSLVSVDLGSLSTVGDRAFQYCTALTTVEFGSVTSVGSSAFAGCTSLASLTFPATVKTVGTGAFSGCTSLTAVDLGSVTEIGDYAFQYCVCLSSVTVSDTVTSIGHNAFGFCFGLTEVDIPASVEKIDDAFIGCTSLTAINVDADNKNYSSADGVLFSRDGKTLISCPSGKYGEYTVPEGTETIASGAFADAVLITAVNISDSVKMISEDAFKGDDGTMEGLRSLCRISFGSGLETIENNAFWHIGFFADGQPLDITSENLKGKTFYLCNGTLDTGFGTEVPAEGHALEDVQETPKTCTADGEKEHRHCSACGKNFIDGKEVSEEDLKIPAGHELVNVPEVPNTSTSDGVKAHQNCTACNKNFIDGKEVSDKDLKIPASGESGSSNILTIALGIIAVIAIIGCAFMFIRMRSMTKTDS